MSKDKYKKHARLIDHLHMIAKAGDYGQIFNQKYCPQITKEIRTLEHLHFIRRLRLSKGGNAKWTVFRLTPSGRNALIDRVTKALSAS